VKTIKTSVWCPIWAWISYNSRRMELKYWQAF